MSVRQQIGLLGLALCLPGCALIPAMRINEAIAQYRVRSQNVQLGDSKDMVLSSLLSTQSQLTPGESKSPESFYKGSNLVEIYYFRSGRQPDGLTTDDEFTPYVFIDGKLSAIGWSVLGGPKTQGKVIPQTIVHPALTVQNKQTQEELQRQQWRIKQLEDAEFRRRREQQ